MDTISYDHLRVRTDTGRAVRSVQQQMRERAGTRVTMSQVLEALLAAWKREHGVFFGLAFDDGDTSDTAPK